MSAARLCYVEGSFAYFTTKPLGDQWGDDWNDAPYEHNAGTPYEWRPTVCRRWPDTDTVETRPNTEEPWEIVKVAYESELETPDSSHMNSSWSVEQINAGVIAWLHDPQYGIRPRTFPGIVWAGFTVVEFCEAIESRGGATYHRSEPT